MEEGGKRKTKQSNISFGWFCLGFFFYSKVCVAKLTVNCGKENSSQGETFFSDSQLADSV